MQLRSKVLITLLSLSFASACSDDKEEIKGECTVDTAGSQDGCASGQVCEEVSGGEPACFATAAIVGRVFDLSTDLGISGARLVSLDANGSARSGIATSGKDGAYALDISIPRDADGKPLTEQVTLRVSAAGYLTFPKTPRQPIPVNLGTATLEDGRWVIQSAATDIGLLPLEDDLATFGSVSGKVVLDGEPVEGGATSGGGVLVVAEINGEAVATAITGTDGSFVLFNVPAGEVTLRALAAGLNAETLVVTVVAGEELKGVTLSAVSGGLSSVTGTITFVDAACGNSTSVILVTESTVEELVPGNPAFVRGEAPPGLRVTGVTGPFSIPNVPSGSYAVLAAFENDCLVRDPDLGIAGTEVVFVSVPASGGTVAAGDFKVTGAIAVSSPGASQLEIINTATPTLAWAKDPSTDHYELRVFDAFGVLVHQNLSIPDPAGGGPVTYLYDGPALEDGMVYQFRALSVATGGTYRSATEDLLGVFQVELTPADAGSQ